MARCTLERYGNSVAKQDFETQDLAIEWVRKTFFNPLVTNASRRTLDPDDDRILIWEHLPDGTRKLVWHCSGMMWDQDARDVDANGLDQGKLPGHAIPLIEELRTFSR